MEEPEVEGQGEEKDSAEDDDAEEDEVVLSVVEVLAVGQVVVVSIIHGAVVDGSHCSGREPLTCPASLSLSIVLCRASHSTWPGLASP